MPAEHMAPYPTSSNGLELPDAASARAPSRAGDEGPRDFFPETHTLSQRDQMPVIGVEVESSAPRVPMPKFSSMVRSTL